MEAPEKIYICPSELAGIDYEEEWLDRPFGDSIEYTRTDAFIEKAVKFLDGCIPDYMELKHANIDTFMDIDNERFIKDFINYMKGK